MAIKTAAEMFGDGSSGNPQVPIDTGNPPGFNANNRGVAFGEQVTSAIKNRTPYALVLNDEDLNARLSAFEVGGLDGAYDLGTVGPVGGGRVIVKDAGAIETVSALSTDYADDPANAHLRVNMASDTIAGAVGLDVRAVNAPFAGVLDRRPISLSTGQTQTPANDPVTLNPGGSLPTTLRTGSGTYHISGDTDLALGFDLVEISGSTSSDGLYVVSGLGVADTDITLSTLSGAAPSFPAGDSATCTFYRVYYRPAAGQGLALHGFPNDQAALLLYPNKAFVASDRDEGAEMALATYLRQNDGTQLLAGGIDSVGSYTQALLRSSLPADDQQQSIKFGNPVTYRDLSGATEWQASHVVYRPDAGNAARYDFLSAIPIENPDIVWDGPFSFFAESPTDGRIDITSAVIGSDYGATLEANLGLLAYLTAGSDTGWYRVVAYDETATEQVTLRTLDGGVPAFPSAGGGTIKLFTTQALGQQPQVTSISTLDADPDFTTITPGASFTAPDTGDGCALTLHAGRLGTAPGRTLLRGVQDLGGGGPTETIRIEPTGDLTTMGPVTAGGFYYVSPPVRNRWIPAEAAMQARYLLSANMPWRVDPSGAVLRLQSAENRAALEWALNAYLPDGAVVSTIKAYVRPGNARVSGDRMVLQYHVNTFLPTSSPTYTGPFKSAGAAGAEEDDGTADYQTIDITGLSLAVNNESSILSGAVDSAIVRLEAGSDAGTFYDVVYGILVSFTDPGPRNY